jgi:hypothetical protein
MAGGMITSTSILQCLHGGSVRILSSNTRSQAAGGFIATMSDNFIVVGCPFQIPATPPIPSPCVTVRWLSGDAKTQINGQPSLSSSSVGLCLNAQQIPQGPVIILGGQTRVFSQ